MTIRRLGQDACICMYLQDSLVPTKTRGIPVIESAQWPNGGITEIANDNVLQLVQNLKTSSGSLVVVE